MIGTFFLNTSFRKKRFLIEKLFRIRELKHLEALRTWTAWRNFGVILMHKHLFGYQVHMLQEFYKAYRLIHSTWPQLFTNLTLTNI